MTVPTLAIAISFTTNPSESPVWEDVSAWCLQVPSIRRGRANELGRFEAGTATVVLDNTDNRFTPGNDFSPYAPNIRPMRRIRIQAVWSTLTWDLFTGYIERWVPIWAGGLECQVQLTCVDAFKLLTQTRSSYTWGVEDSHWRVWGVLNSIGWPETERVMGVGSFQIAAVALNAESPMPHLQEVVAAEGGQLFMDAAGRVVFEGRTARNATSVLATFGDMLDVTNGWVLGTSLLGQTTIPRAADWTPGVRSHYWYLRAVPSYDDAFIVNEARLNKPGGATWVSSVPQGAISQARYGLRSRTQTLILATELAVAQRADWMVLEYAEPDLRFVQLAISGYHDPNLWFFQLSLDLSQRVAVVRSIPGAYALYRECWIEGIEHAITATGWETTYSLSTVRSLYA